MAYQVFDQNMLKMAAKIAVNDNQIVRAGIPLRHASLTFGDDTITRSSGSWVDDGWVLGAGAMVVGGSNDGKGSLVINVSASVLTLAMDTPFTHGTFTCSVHPTLDGRVVLDKYDRVLVLNALNVTDNGLFEVAAPSWRRPSDANSDVNFKQNCIIPVSTGPLAGLWKVASGSLSSGFLINQIWEGGTLVKAPCKSISSSSYVTFAGIEALGLSVSLTMGIDAEGYITRSSGSWVTDGWAVGAALLIDGGISQRGCVVTGVTGSMLTVNIVAGGVWTPGTYTVHIHPITDVQGLTKLSRGDRVLDIHNPTSANRGIWVVTKGAWVRAADANSESTLTAGAIVFVINVPNNAPNWYILSNGGYNQSQNWDALSRIITVGGDLSGTADNATVQSIRGRQVTSASPSNGDTLKWNSGANRWDYGASGGFYNAKQKSSPTTYLIFGGKGDNNIGINFPDDHTAVLASGNWSTYGIGVNSGVKFTNTIDGGANSGKYYKVTSVAGNAIGLDTTGPSGAATIESGKTYSFRPIINLDTPYQIEPGDIVLDSDNPDLHLRGLKVAGSTSALWDEVATLSVGSIIAVAYTEASTPKLWILSSLDIDMHKTYDYLKTAKEYGAPRAFTMQYSGPLTGTGSAQVVKGLSTNFQTLGFIGPGFPTNTVIDIQADVLIRGGTYRASVTMRGVFKTDSGTLSRLDFKGIYHGGSDGGFTTSSMSGTDYTFDLAVSGGEVNLKITTPNATVGTWVADITVRVSDG